jgi:hypothetical protein
MTSETETCPTCGKPTAATESAEEKPPTLSELIRLHGRRRTMTMKQPAEEKKGGGDDAA